MNVFDLYLAAVTSAYVALKVQRMDQLRGLRMSRWDTDGLHVPSKEWGRAKCLEKVEPSLRELDVTLGELREAAYEDALAEFLEYETRAAA